MEIIKSRIIDFIEVEKLPINQEICITDCVINVLNFNFCNLKNLVTIKNCIINTFQINSCWFENGLKFTNNVVKNDIDYQMGGHNKDIIIITNNIFCGFFDFFDCHFENEIRIERNVFVKGSNIKGNLKTGYHNTFEKKLIDIDNVGKLDIDC